MPDLVPAVIPAGRLCSLPQPTLQAGQLTLRPWRLSDAEAVVEAYRDPDIRHWHVQSVGLHRIELCHSALNPVSCRVADKAGFRYEGTRRQHFLHRDGWHDMHLHARLAAGETAG
jgi:RimJ/RimL family protein N-acetyltransferase